MKKVIKGFGKFPESRQEEIYELYRDGELKRATFPFQGSIEDGVIFEPEDEEEEVTYLIPVSTIKASKFSTSDDDDDDDDSDSDPDDDIDVGEDADDLGDEE